MAVIAIPSWTTSELDDVVAQLQSLLGDEYGLTVSKNVENNRIIFTNNANNLPIIHAGGGFLQVVSTAGTNIIEMDQRGSSTFFYVIKGDNAFALKWGDSPYETTNSPIIVSKDTKNRLCCFWFTSSSTTRRLHFYVPEYANVTASLIGAFSDQKNVGNIRSTTIIPYPIPDNADANVICEHVFITALTNTLPVDWYGEVFIGNYKYYVALSTALFKMTT